MKVYFPVALVVFLLIGCSKYEIKNDVVYYKEWNEARGNFLTEVRGADSKSFKPYGVSGYGSDGSLVFYRTKVIEGADPESFESIQQGFSKDEKHCFYRELLIQKADPKTFEVLDNEYSKDSKRVYFRSSILEGADSESFKVLDRCYAKDRNDMYFEGDAFKTCDIDKFRFLSGSDGDRDRWSTDGCHYYMRGDRIPSDDYASVVIYENSAGFAKDHRMVYYLDHEILFNPDGKRILDTVDVQTFEVTDFFECKDKFGCINVYHGRAGCN